jgi:hypothetical protein
MSRLSCTSGVCLSITGKSSHRYIPGIRDGGRLPGTGRLKLERIITVIGLWALASYPATAALVYITPSVGFDNTTATVIDTQGGQNTSDDDTSLGSSELAQFDASLGVLTGVTINLLDSTRTQSVTVTSTDGNNNGNNNNRTSTGTGNSTAGISAPGMSFTLPSLSTDGSCTAPRQEACSPAVTTTAVSDPNQNQAATSDSFDSYVGGGTVTVSRTAPTFNAMQNDNVFTGEESTQNVLNWTGKLSATYSYLLHAAPSFDSSASAATLILDFGTVAQNSSVSPMIFSIFNLTDPSRTDLDLDSFIAAGDTSALDSGLSTFANLGQGYGQLFQATLNTTNAGDFLATYTLTLSDAVNIGAASSQSIYTLVLTLKGNITAASTVPVPDAVWLFGTGLVGLVGVGRRGKH